MCVLFVNASLLEDPAEQEWFHVTAQCERERKMNRKNRGTVFALSIDKVARDWSQRGLRVDPETRRRWTRSPSPETPRTPAPPRPRGGTSSTAGRPLTENGVQVPGAGAAAVTSEACWVSFTVLRSSVDGKLNSPIRISDVCFSMFYYQERFACRQ